MKAIVCARFLAASLVLGTAVAAQADNHEEESPGLALLSIYEYAPGMVPAEFEKSMVEYQKAQEEAGFDDCGLYRHEYGDTRGLYAYCMFKDMQQFAKIADANPSSPETEPQPFAGHSDHMVAFVERNMTKAAPYLVFSHYRFDSGLSYNQAMHYGKKLFALYDEAFGGCNAYVHVWGPELGMYTACGFENYADLAAKGDRLGEMIEAYHGDEPLFVEEHSDDILKLVMD